jgi:hypothetical protein
VRRQDPGRALAATKNPPMSSGGRRTHKTETRISAIADLARERKQEKKCAPVIATLLE